MGTWQVITMAMIPLPLALVVILVLPWPTNIDGKVLALVERILRQPILGTELIFFGTTASAIALGSQIYGTTMIYGRKTEDYDSLSPNQQCGYRAMKLRAERNWWISALALCLWLMLYKLIKVRYASALHRAEIEKFKSSESELTSSFLSFPFAAPKTSS